MSQLDSILEFNKSFVLNKGFAPYKASNKPSKKLLIVTCMDARLINLLQSAMNLKNGDANIVRIAGALICSPYGSAMRSVLLSIASLGATEVIVVGHHDCGVTGLNKDALMSNLMECGVTKEKIRLANDENPQMADWLSGFNEPAEGVKMSVQMIIQHPLFPPNISVHGLVMHPATGKLEVISRDSCCIV